LREGVSEYVARGYPVLQCGKIDDDEHYYLDTEKDFGYIVELGNAGRIRPVERRYPQP
jgi:methylmalonyl-CoA/ethylmalonyl-CoA epimerase